MIWFDQDVDLRGRQQQHYYDSAPLGVASPAAGVVVAGVGVYFLMRDLSKTVYGRVFLSQTDTGVRILSFNTISANKAAGNPVGVVCNALLQD
ncbi:MAG TPA: hypothetical protein VF469_20290 [Kofleriaceae bacterium]